MISCNMCMVTTQLRIKIYPQITGSLIYGVWRSDAGKWALKDETGAILGPLSWEMGQVPWV